MRRVASLLLLAFLAAAPAVAQSLPERSDRIVDYRISVTLDPVKHLLTGRETLTWRNPSTTDAVQELCRTRSTFPYGGQSEVMNRSIEEAMLPGVIQRYL